MNNDSQQVICQAFSYAPLKDQEILIKLRDIAINIIKDQDFILKETYEDLSYDNEILKCYTINLSLSAEAVSELNDKFIDFCLNDDKSNILLKQDIVFMFTSER